MCHNTRINIKITPLSLNGNMNNFEWRLKGEYFSRKIQKWLHTMKMVMKKVPLLHKSAKKVTLSSDLLRSESHSEKGTLFWEFLYPHVNTCHKSGPPGRTLTCNEELKLSSVFKPLLICTYVIGFDAVSVLLGLHSDAGGWRLHEWSTWWWCGDCNLCSPMESANLLDTVAHLHVPR